MLHIIYRKILNLIVRLEGGQAFSRSLRKWFLKRYNISVGYGSYGGCFNEKNIPAGTEFGRYCSIAQGVKIFRANHPMEYFTLHPLFCNPRMGYVKMDMLSRPKLIVGHDVWIGDSVIILPNCRIIGNGAIIGAGSIVTKDVAPYSILVGNPAKVIKMRFSEDIIQKLEATCWWLLDKEDLIEKKEKFEKIAHG